MHGGVVMGLLEALGLTLKRTHCLNVQPYTMDLTKVENHILKYRWI